MSELMTFDTEQEAREYIRTMDGWEAYPVEIVLGGKNVWIVSCKEGQKRRYLQKEGYVR